MLENQKFLIVLDCDGTLLNDEKKILPKTKAYLMELAKRGNIITMASGRPDRAVLPYYRELECHGPFIGYNGSIILDPDDKKFPVFKKKYPLTIIKDFLSHFKIDDFSNIMAEDEKNLFFLYEDHEYENYFHPEGMNVFYGPMLELFKEDLFGFIISLKDPNLLFKVQDVISKYDDIGFRPWINTSLIGEFFFYSVNKSTAIERLQKYYQIDRAHVIAFGDADNDIEMIKKAGVSFAMQNGSEVIKKVADYITPFDNNHEGIYFALKKFLDDDR